MQNTFVHPPRTCPKPPKLHFYAIAYFWPSGPCPRLKGRNTVGHRQAAGSTESRSRPGFADRLDTHLRLAIGISTSCMLLPAWPGRHAGRRSSLLACLRPSGKTPCSRAASTGKPACLPACLPAWLPACLPACLGPAATLLAYAMLEVLELMVQRRLESWTPILYVYVLRAECVYVLRAERHCRAVLDAVKSARHFLFLRWFQNCHL